MCQPHQSWSCFCSTGPGCTELNPNSAELPMISCPSPYTLSIDFLPKLANPEPLSFSISYVKKSAKYISLEHLQLYHRCLVGNLTATFG